MRERRKGGQKVREKERICMDRTVEIEKDRRERGGEEVSTEREGVAIYR